MFSAHSFPLDTSSPIPLTVHIALTTLPPSALFTLTKSLPQNVALLNGKNIASLQHVLLAVNRMVLLASSRPTPPDLKLKTNSGLRISVAGSSHVERAQADFGFERDADSEQSVVVVVFQNEIDEQQLADLEASINEASNDEAATPVANATAYFWPSDPPSYRAEKTDRLCKLFKVSPNERKMCGDDITSAIENRAVTKDLC